MTTQLRCPLAFTLTLATLSGCAPDFDDIDDIDGDARLDGDLDDPIALDEQSILPSPATDPASSPILLEGSCPNDPPHRCSALSLFDDVTADTSHLWSLDDHPGSTNYQNNPPNNQTKHWIMGDWDGDGDDSPGYHRKGTFSYTNTPAAPGGSWSQISITDGYALVAGRFHSGYDHDCVGMISIANPEEEDADTKYMLEYWCDPSNPPAPGSHGSQWIGAVLPDSQRPAGVHEFVAGDWDGDGIDELAVRKDQFIAYSLSDPETGLAAFAQAQRWGVPPGEQAETGVFVAGDWDGNGLDSWGVLYDDNHFFYRNDPLVWNPGPDAYYLQHITNLYAQRSVSSHQLDLDPNG